MVTLNMSETSTGTFLERIVAATRATLAERQARLPLAELRALTADAPAPRPFAEALRPALGGSARLIGEVKRASPSKGLLAEAYDPVGLARAYEAGGAAAISVLTEPQFFLGALDHLRAVRAAVALPVLRKDFLLDAYQVYEARAAGADAVLLICALLDNAQLADLLALAQRLGMEALVEAHNAAEARRAVAIGARVIGVNSRDLHSFTVDTEVVRHLRPLVPADRIFVAESGIFEARGAASSRAWGADAILVGEALMRAHDPATKARELASAPGGATHRFFSGVGVPFVKICGLAAAEQVRVAADAGADAFGLVFAPMAPDHRHITPAQARALVAAAREHGTALLPVGVFVGEAPTTIAEIARDVGLGAVQLSGDESPEQCAEVAALTGLPVLKALRPQTADDLAALDAYALAGVTLMLDTPKAGNYGGSGETGDWALARQAARRWPVILSGGLTPANVGVAVASVVPRGVDVSSGVESLIGTTRAKDLAKIQAFIAAAREAGHSLEIEA